MKIKEFVYFKKNKFKQDLYDLITGLFVLIGFVSIIASWLIAGMFFLYEIIHTKYSFFHIMLNTLGVFFGSMLFGALIILIIMTLDNILEKKEDNDKEIHIT